MVDYGLKDKVAIITGANNPQGIGATTALAFAKEGANVVLVYKKIFRDYNIENINENGVDRYFAANAGNADVVEQKLKEINEQTQTVFKSGEMIDSIDMIGFYDGVSCLGYYQNIEMNVYSTDLNVDEMMSVLSSLSVAVMK